MIWSKMGKIGKVVLLQAFCALFLWGLYVVFCGLMGMIYNTVTPTMMLAYYFGGILASGVGGALAVIIFEDL